MQFPEIIRKRRESLHLGIRETARLTERSYVPHPILSPVYISRLENRVDEEMRADAVSIDKCWALGVALQVNPLILFAYSRELPELIDLIPNFKYRDSDPVPFPTFLKRRRDSFGLSMRKLVEVAVTVSPWDISSGYLSQIETDDDHIAEHVSGEKLWTLGRVLHVDPLLLYALSRKMDPRFLSAASRDRLFS